MSTITLDIETGPLSADLLAEIEPKFEAPSNYKDEAKIEANIEEQRRRWREKAALSADTGMVLAIGILHEQGERRIIGHGGGGSSDSLMILPSEADVLKAFWIAWEQAYTQFTWIGHNIIQFDLPFLMRRSWINRVAVPKTARLKKYGNDYIEDTMQIWAGADGDRISLARLAKLLGVGSKGGIGADFAGAWASDRQAAADYLTNDLILAQAVYGRIA